MAVSRVNRENFVVVQGFMLTDLKLKGNELIIYAIIYGFSQAENQVFNGSLQYLADWTNSTKQSVLRCLKSLTEKGFIEKMDKILNGVKFCEYRATNLTTVLKKVEYPINESLTAGGQEMITGGIQENSPNIISLNNTLNNIVEKDKDNKPVKHKYGEYKNVLLTDEQLETLKAEFPNDWADRIEELSEGIEYKGYKYKNHLIAIRKWAKKSNPKPTQPKQQQSNNAFYRAAQARGLVHKG